MVGKRNQKKKKLNNRKLDNNRKQAVQKRSIEYPDQLKQVENNKKWKEFTNLKPGNYMTYRSGGAREVPLKVVFVTLKYYL